MGKRYASLQQRIIVNSKVMPNGCWEWQLMKQRYGIVMFEGKGMKAHRLSWQAFKGNIPAGLNVLHTCDNPPCVNPDHLWLGTQKDNVHDAIAKGRNGLPPDWRLRTSARGDANGMRKYPGLLAGERNGRSKMSDKERLHIWYLKSHEGWSTADLGKRYGLNPSQINRIVSKWS